MANSWFVERCDFFWSLNEHGVHDKVWVWNIASSRPDELLVVLTVRAQVFHMNS